MSRVSAKTKLDNDFEERKRKVVELLMIANGVKPEEFDEEFKILFVVEGHSASSGIRTKRDNSVHGVLALRGKILNVWGKNLSAAMRSDIVKEYLTVVKEENYKYVVLMCDADPDGDHIRTLLIGCTKKFANSLIKDGKLLNGYTPLYTYHDKNNKLVTWSKDKLSIPGLTIKDNKGLGSYDYDSITKLILYPQLGATYIRIEDDKTSDKYLTDALTYGCVNWVKIDE